MPISAEERVAAKRAYAQLRSYEASGCIFILGSSLLLFFMVAMGASIAGGLMVVEEHGKILRGWPAFLSFLSFDRPPFVLWAALFGQLLAYLRGKARSAKNLAFVSKLEREHAAELPYGLELEVQQDLSRPRRGRALLWRLDAFLSRNKAGATTYP